MSKGQRSRALIIISRMTVFVSYQQQVLSGWVGEFCECLEWGTPAEVQRVLPGTRHADVASNHCSTNYTTESTDLGQTLLGWSLCPSHQLSGWLTAAAEPGQRHHVVNTSSSYGWAHVSIRFLPDDRFVRFNSTVDLHSPLYTDKVPTDYGRLYCRLQ